MSYPTDRAMLFDRSMSPLPELSPSEVYSRLRGEEINGEHALVMVTTRRLEEGWRMLTVDGTGRWREWVVTEPDEDHSAGRNALGTYRFVWSLQYDLTRSYSHTHAEVGYGDCPKTAQEAAAIVLQDVPFWTVGACDGAAISSGEGCVFIYESAWSRLSKLVELTGWEVDSTITVSPLYGVTARQLHLLAHVGSEEATRRFEWDADLTSIRRTPDPGPYYCRVVPLGKGETEYAEDDETTFEWPLDITEETGTEENPGPYYIEDAEAAAVFRYADGNGGWVYPAVAVEYDEDDPELLLNAAMDDLHSHTRPGVTYEASVLQLEQAGMGAHGISLGDDIQCVDLGFNPDAALRIQGRVIKMEVDELSPSTTAEVTIGQLRDSMNGVLSTMAQSLDALNANTSRIRDTLSHFDTARYVKDLLSRINSEIAATGGYTYLTEGEGLITYDIAVDDPLIGYNSTADAWATQVVQIKGGSIRIANSKHAGFQGIDDWDWKTVFTSGHILSELITAVAITSGYIGDVSDNNHWNLDSGELVLSTVSDFDGVNYYGTPFGAHGTKDRGIQTKHGIINGTGHMTECINGSDPGERRYAGLGLQLTLHGYDNITGEYLGTKGVMLLSPSPITGDDDHWSSFSASGNLHILSHIDRLAATNGMAGQIWLHENMADIAIAPYKTGINSLYPDARIRLNNGNSGGSVTLYARDMTVSSYRDREVTLDASGLTVGQYTPATMNNTLTVGGNLTVNSNISSIGSCFETTPHQSSAYLSYNIVRADNLYVGHSGDTSAHDGGPGDGRVFCGYLAVGSNGYNGQFYVTGTKSRALATEHYGTRELYSYETPTPMFGDIGSGLVDDDGVCVVALDDMFCETARTDHEYQVFLQKCGQGDVWVSEKHQYYFVVQGTPGLPFDWEVKAKQNDFEALRLEDTNSFSRNREEYELTLASIETTNEQYDPANMVAEAFIEEIEAQYENYHDYIAAIEDSYYDELLAS